MILGVDNVSVEDRLRNVWQTEFRSEAYALNP